MASHSLPNFSAAIPSAQADLVAKQPIYALTGLRFVAVLSVVLFHFGFIVSYPLSIRLIAVQSSAAVSFFFALSGFVLFYNYHDRFATQIDRKGYWKFLQARFARLYPMYVLALLLVTPLTLISLSLEPIQMAQQLGTKLTGSLIELSWLANLLGVQSWLPFPVFGYLWNNPAWCVTCEFFFYALFPFFVAYLYRHFRRTASLLRFLWQLFIIEALFSLILATLAYSLPAQPQHWFIDFLEHRFPLTRMWEFFLGCTLGAIFLRRRQQIESYPFARKFDHRAFRNGVLLLVVVGIVAVTALSQVSGPLGYFFHVLRGHVLYTPLVLLTILTLASGPTFLSGFLENRWVLLLGEASYSLYITHWITFSVLTNLMGTGVQIGIGWVSLSILLTIFVSVILLQYVELPLRQVLRT